MPSAMASLTTIADDDGPPSPPEDVADVPSDATNPATPATEADVNSAMPDGPSTTQQPAQSETSEKPSMALAQSSSPTNAGDECHRSETGSSPIPIPRPRTNRSFRPDSGLASVSSMPAVESVTRPMSVETRIRIQETDGATGLGARPSSCSTGPVFKTTAPSIADGRSITSKRSLGGRSIAAASMVSPEDEILSLKVRSLYDSGVGSDACSQFSGDYTRRRVSSILEENNTAAKRGFRNSYAEGTASLPEMITEGFERRYSEGDGDQRPFVPISPDAESCPTEISESKCEMIRPSTSAAHECWEGLGEGVTIDRYGFVNQEYVSSSAEAPERPFTAPKRVTTALFNESKQQRRKRPHLHHLHFHRSAPDMLHSPLPEQAKIMKQKEATRSKKWREMAVLRKKSERGLEGGKGAGIEWSFVTRDPKLISRTWKGIPDCWRAAAWHAFLTASSKKRGIGKPDSELVEIYNELIEMPSADDVQIDLDVPRTITAHILFRRRYTGGQRLLFRVLHCLGLYFPEVGYVQGMASLAATLLCYYEEETAFIMLVRLWELRGLEKLFKHGFGGLMAALEEFEGGWMKGGLISKKLLEMGITGTAYGTRWYLTLFHYSIPFAAQLRVWDVFMLLGDPDSGSPREFGGQLDVLHATSAALIDSMRSIILSSDFEGAMKVLTSFIPVKDEDLLMKVAKNEWKTKRRRWGSIAPH